MKHKEFFLCYSYRYILYKPTMATAPTLSTFETFVTQLFPHKASITQKRRTPLEARLQAKT